ncbi:MAG: hypothetical protein VX970_08405 [Planctomycetota bacterium]|nr:hypothetical protein [Planctomycetota bacterium]
MRFLQQCGPMSLMMAGLLLNGCKPPSSIQEPGQATAAAGHQHDGDGVDGSDQQHHHDHDHDHPHDHHHSHAAVKSSHGGRMIPIGHTHHANGATHYYAEIMPTEKNKLSFYLTHTDEHGVSQPVQVDGEEVVGYAAPLDQQAGLATELVFLATENDDQSAWSATIPASLKTEGPLSVVVPKIILGGEWINFSFKTSNAPPQIKSKETPSEESE